MRTITTMKKLGISLDLALEANELLRGAAQKEIPGVQEDIETHPNAKVTTITILNDQGAAMMGKPSGRYVTIEAPEIRYNRGITEEISVILAEKLRGMLKISPNGAVLLIGLGNWNATPDALGPQVVDNSTATRHLYQFAPEAVEEGMRPLCALAPGVLGITGIETAEIIKGVVDRVKPECIIAVDALAAANISRISTTIQIADTGISPGSGLGNQRMGINQQSMGVPVIAIGVPTVVNAAVIVHETLSKLQDTLGSNINSAVLAKYINPDLSQELIQQLFEKFEGNLVVTPKEVDELITNVAEIIAAGVAQAVHPGATRDNYHQYLQ